MNFIKWFTKDRENIQIIIFIFAFLLLLFGIQIIILDGVDKGFWKSIVPSAIVDVISIVITTFGITYLVQKNNKQRTKEKLKNIIGSLYEKLYLKIVSDYLMLIKGQIVNNNPSDKFYAMSLDNLLLELQDLKENSTKYIDKEFFRKISRSVPVTYNGQMNSIDLTKQQHTAIFKEEILISLDKFITKYLSVLNDEIREILFKTEELLNSSVFQTFIEQGLYKMKHELSYQSIDGDFEYIKNKHEEFIELLINALGYFKDSTLMEKENKLKKFKRKLSYGISGFFIWIGNKGEFLIWLILIPMLVYIWVNIIL